jgi:hypothetical protein
MDWSTSVAISVKTSISPSSIERHACVEDVQSQMMENKLKASCISPKDPFQDPEKHPTTFV